MVAAQRGHHGAAARAGRHDGAAHGVPHVHEADRARGVGADALHQRALGAQRGEVVADAAALLHGERGFLDVLEDGAEVVLDAAHHEAVEERDVAAGAGAGQDAAGRQEGEIGHGLGEAPWPSARGRAWARRRQPPAATRAQVSSRVRSTALPSAALRRYFMSQICWEIGGSGGWRGIGSEYRKDPAAPLVGPAGAILKVEVCSLFVRASIGRLQHQASGRTRAHAVEGNQAIHEKSAGRAENRFACGPLS